MEVSLRHPVYSAHLEMVGSAHPTTQVDGNKCLCWMSNVRSTEGFG